jgi:Ni/Co efflux regulator RcnB
MKLLIATVALATMIAAPAFAQNPTHRARAEHSQHVRAADQTTQYGRTENGQRHSTNPTHDVYDGSGNYIGSDPDSRIRQYLLSDYNR